MNTRNKKALYESIMKSVSKTVKRKLNEDADFEADELLDTLTDDDVFYIMEESTARRLRNQMSSRGKCFTIEDKVVFVPSIDDQNFYVQLNQVLIKNNDYNFFTVATCATDGDDLIGNIRMYCNLI